MSIFIVCYRPFDLGEADFLNLICQHAGDSLRTKLGNYNRVEIDYLDEDLISFHRELALLAARQIPVHLLILNGDAFDFTDPWLAKTYQAIPTLICGCTESRRAIRFWAAGAKEAYADVSEFAKFLDRLEKLLNEIEAQKKATSG